MDHSSKLRCILVAMIVVLVLLSMANVLLVSSFVVRNRSDRAIDVVTSRPYSHYMSLNGWVAPMHSKTFYQVAPLLNEREARVYVNGKPAVCGLSTFMERCFDVRVNDLGDVACDRCR